MGPDRRSTQEAPGAKRRRRESDRTALQALGNGRYELSEFVSKGGMGAVYRARDVELDRWVAVKCLLDVVREGSRELAVKEARTLAQLSHPNIMRVYDILSVRDQVWIVSEWLEGRCLAQLRLPLPPGCVLAIMTQVYDALAAAHQAQVVHRDIKPANVMIGNDGRVTLIDFGVAFAPGASTGEMGSGISTLGRGVPAMAGSLRYTDPRILEGEPPDTLSDLFSAALLQVELMTGETVLPDLAPLPLYRHIKKNLEGRLDSLLDGAYPPLTALARKFTGRLRTDPEFAQVEPEAAREAALLSNDILRKLTPRAPDQYLAAGLCLGEVGDPIADRLIADETETALASKMLSPRQKAAWIAFKAATEEPIAERPKRLRADPPVGRRHQDRRAYLIAELKRRRALAFSSGLATFVLATLLLWVSWPVHLRHGDDLPLVDQPAVAAATDAPLGPTQDGSNHGPYGDRFVGVAGKPDQALVDPLSLAAAPRAADRTGAAGQTAGAAPGSGRAASPADSAGPGAVDVHLVADAWANVILDGREVGRLPQAAPFRLAPGRHALMLTSPTVEPLATEIDVVAGGPVRLHFHLEPRVTLRTIRLRQPGRLFVDGTDHGVVTAKQISLSYGTHRLWVSREGQVGVPTSVALGPDSGAEIVLD